MIFCFQTYVAKLDLQATAANVFEVLNPLTGCMNVILRGKKAAFLLPNVHVWSWGFFTFLGRSLKAKKGVFSPLLPTQMARN